MIIYNQNDIKIIVLMSKCANFAAKLQCNVIDFDRGFFAYAMPCSVLSVDICLVNHLFFNNIKKDKNEMIR